IPFMFLSIYQDAHMVRQAAHNGAVGYLVKPVSNTQLIPAIEAALVRAQEIRHLRKMMLDLAQALASQRKTGDLMRDELKHLTARHEIELNKLLTRLNQAH